MTYGTESVPKTYKIFGPGNQYVTAAKQWASRLGVAIDMPAGPSELLVVADDSAVAEFIASDLLSQAEHGADSQVLLLTDDPNIQEAVEIALQSQIRELPREEIARGAMANSRGIVLQDREALAEMVNAYAPEHLIIAHRQEDYLLDHIENAGSVFLGNYTPESAGDYASGTNHTLPTNGYARQYSGVNLSSYTKSITYQRISPEGLRVIGPAVETMARAEGLEAHAQAITLRLKTLAKKPSNL
jgi:histidinol dehydrogenase